LIRRQSIAQAIADADILDSGVSSAPEIRLGVAGLGGMGMVHAGNARALPGARLVAVAAAREGRAEEVGAELGIDACSLSVVVLGVKRATSAGPFCWEACWCARAPSLI